MDGNVDKNGIDAVKFGERYDGKIVVCLGFFDSVHKGHAELISTGRKLADRANAKLAVFTFSAVDGNTVLTFKERLSVLSRLGVDVVLHAEFDDNFRSIDKDSFLDTLFTYYDVKGVVFGEDYTFGKDRQGNSEYLGKVLKDKRIDYRTVKLLAVDGEKYSTRAIKSLLSDGDIEKVNSYLSYKYFLTGEVKEGRKVGNTLGFPTANVFWTEGKHPLKDGVYGTEFTVDGKTYKAITNVGGAPTFGVDTFLTETHAIGFTGNVYGKTVKIEFIKRIRDIRKFATADELTKQLDKDLRWYND